ncbi:MAG TPA: hypothetical protein ENN84_06540 [Candidatus Marinimicrobia bacterium]|nr:hypothetical protein [Candidatus Neomarinimicrobiota bacterium]
MKKKFIILLFFVVVAPGQTEERFYEAFEGGGIAYTPSLLLMPDIAFPAMSNSPKIEGQQYFHGVSGWSALSKRWRIGAQVLSGKISSTGTLGANIEKSEFTLSSGMLLTEYIFPVTHSNHFVLSFAFGVSQISLNYQLSSPAIAWSDIFSVQSSQTLTAKTLPTLAPQIAWLWQFSKRAGFRVNAGAHIFRIRPDAWKLNDFITVTDGYGNQDALLISPMLQIFIYFGA